MNRTDRTRLAAPIHGVSVYTGVVARTHDASNPLRYPELPLTPNGHELRRADQLPKIAAGLVGKPVTHEHTTTEIGRVISAKVDGDTVVAELLITNQLALKDLRAGKSELSLSYAVDIEDGYQIIKRVDGVGLVTAGRCGPDCRVEHGDHAPPDDEAAANAALARRLQFAYVKADGCCDDCDPAINDVQRAKV